MTFQKQMYIADELTTAQVSVDVFNPANDSLVATVPTAGIAA